MPRTYSDAVKQGKLTKSLYKFFLSFMVLADHDVSIRCGDEVYEFPLRELRIANNFWRADGCYRTGQCCSKVSMDLFLSEQELSQLKALYPGKTESWQSMMLQLQVRSFDAIAHSTHTVWTRIGGNECAFLDRHMGPDGFLDPKTGKQWEVSGCTIHELNPIHCALPHLYFDIKNTKKPISQQYVNITKRQFGRNWAFGCPVHFTQYNEFARRRDLLLLNRCRELLIEFTGTANRVSDIIQRVEQRQLLVDPDALTVI